MQNRILWGKLLGLQDAVVPSASRAATAARMTRKIPTPIGPQPEMGNEPWHTQTRRDL